MRLDGWGAGPFIITVGERMYRFEDFDRFGPLLVSKRDVVLEEQPGERHPFWRGFNPWRAQGRQLEPNGVTCIWRKPKPTKVRQITRRFRLIVENGEEGGDIEIAGGRT